MRQPTLDFSVHVDLFIKSKIFVMQQNEQPVSIASPIISFSVVLTAMALKYGFTSDPRWYKLGYVSVALLIIGLADFQKNQMR
jgi:hypothetical protein